MISCEPEIIEKELSPDDEYLVLASDGIWDVLNNDQVAKFVSKAQDFVQCAKDLCSEALLCGSSDNITALVIDLKYVSFFLLTYSVLICHDRRRQKLPEPIGVAKK